MSQKFDSKSMIWVMTDDACLGWLLWDHKA